ncbi:MAG: hypothetical protein QNK37_11325 [Acidobacteriota bacterium]|nr:hypothetical protein [Acidobacteriota bacterium]
MLQLARLCLEDGEPDKAHGMVQKAIGKIKKKNRSARAPNGLSPIEGEARLLEGHVLTARGEDADAEMAFLAAWRLGARDRTSLSFMAARLLARGDRSDQAHQIYASYLQHAWDRDDPEQMKRNLAFLEEISRPDPTNPGQMARAYRWNRKILKYLTRVPWVYHHLGRIAYAREDWPEAVRMYGREVELAPGERGRLMLSRVLFLDGRIDEAAGHLDKLVECPRYRAEALLRRAHLRRLQGNGAAALQDFRAASVERLLEGEHLLAYAEILINQALAGEAANILDRFSDHDDPRWQFLKAHVDLAAQRLDEAVAGFRGIVLDSVVGGQAAQQLIWLAAEKPGATWALPVLKEIPSEYHDETYGIALGNAYLETGNPEASLRAWLSIEEWTEPRVRTFGAVAQWLFTDLYRRDNPLKIIELWTEFPAEKLPGEIWEIIQWAALRQIVRSFSLTRDSAYTALMSLEDMEARMLDQPSTSLWKLCRGMILAVLGEYREAVGELESLSAADPNNASAHLVRAFCALYRDDRQACHDLLSGDGLAGEPSLRLAIIMATLEDDWQTAARRLTQLNLEPHERGYQAAILFKAGQSDKLEEIAAEDHAVRYYRAADLARANCLTEALEVIGLIQKNRPLHTAECHLFSWLLVKKALIHHADGNGDGMISCLRQAFTLWPGAAGLVARLPKARKDWLAWYLMTGDRKRAGKILGRMTKKGEVADPHICRLRGLLHLAEAARCFLRRESKAMLKQMRLSIAFIGIPLTQPEFLREWIGRRFETYEIEAMPQASGKLKEQVVKYYETILYQWKESLEKEGLSEVARAVYDLPLAFRAELNGAQLVCDYGGLTVGDRMVWAGAEYVSVMGLEQPFAEFFDSLQTHTRTKTSVLDEGPPLLRLLQLIQDDQDEEGVEPDVVQEIAYMFSGLRIAAVLRKQDRPEEALKWVQCRKDAKVGPPLTGYPAFSGDTGIEVFQKIVATFEMELCTEVGSRYIAKTDQGPVQALAHWRQAMKLARKIGRQEEIGSSIEQTALGRAKVLIDKDREQEAIKILTGVRGLYTSSKLEGMLASSYANLGVMAGNQEKWQKAVRNLRSARKLNPHSTHINKNLIRALLGRADQVHSSSPGKSGPLLEEALKIAHEQLRDDPHDQDLQELISALDIRLALVSLQEPDDVDPMELFGRILGDSLQNRKRSAFYHNRGVEKVNRGNLEEGIRDLEKALELEPDSEETREMLRQARAMHALTSGDSSEGLIALLELIRNANLNQEEK